MGHPTWVYHRELPPNIIDSDDFESAKALGWSDTPATFLAPQVVEIVNGALREAGVLSAIETASEPMLAAAIKSANDMLKDATAEQKPGCKKCGKVFERGLFMHEKHCKG